MVIQVINKKIYKEPLILTIVFVLAGFAIAYTLLTSGHTNKATVDNVVPSPLQLDDDNPVRPQQPEQTEGPDMVEPPQESAPEIAPNVDPTTPNLNIGDNQTDSESPLSNITEGVKLHE